MNIHVLLKFRYHWDSDDGQVNTMDEHQAVVKAHGSCWWGRTSTVAQNRADQLRVQLNAGIETWVFLYSIGVPKRVHEDRTLWFVGKLKAIELSRPSTIERIPAYYREMNLDSYFLITDIKTFVYSPGKTPKVPGQAALRYLTLTSKEPKPENIQFLSDEKKSLLKPQTQFAGIPLERELEASDLPKQIDVEELKSKIIDLQEDVIRLQEVVGELRTYKDYYNKILNTDYLFSSERFFESWLQDNMHKILPELEVLDRQPQARWPDGKFGRLDLLAANKESHDLCIIEVKTRKRSVKSGYDQFVRYVSWAKRNREQLAKAYSGHSLQPSESPSFVIITDYVDDEMAAICKDHGITLIHVFGGLGFEKIV